MAAAASRAQPGRSHGTLPSSRSLSSDDYCGLLDLCFEEEIHEVADAMVANGMLKLGYKLM